jgi:hypothetical protein
MSSCSDLQSYFQHYIFQDDQSICDHVIGTKKVSKETRLKIYSDAYRLRLQAALDSSYPILKKYLGNKPFEKICNAYIDHHPSHYRSIRWYGDQFSLFLKLHTKYKRMPHLNELALWEWKSALVFDAENATVLSLNEMASLTPDLWPSVKFKIHPTIQQINLYSNIVPIWEALCDEKEPPALVKNNKPITWILWRKELVSQYISIPEDEAYALDAIISGKTFSEMCEQLCEYIAEEDVGLRAASFLKGWITQGLIEKIKVQ